MRWFFGIAAFFLLATAEGSQPGVVITDGALVYRKADFDSKIIGSFKAGTKVMVSNKAFGAFFRVRFQQGVLGYIADTDVLPDGKKQVPPGKTEEGAPREKKERSTPIAKRISVGPQIGAIAFREFIGKTENQETLTSFGLKVTFPAGFLQGPFQMESNFFGHPGAPNYYKKFTSSETASGGVWVFDLVLDYAIDQTDTDVLYLGSGPLVSFTQIQAEVAGKNSDLSEIKAGAVISFGYARWLGGVCIRGEAKYYLEETSYYGGALAVQFDIN